MTMHNKAIEIREKCSELLSMPVTVTQCAEKDGFVFRIYSEYPNYIPFYIAGEDLKKEKIQFMAEVLKHKFETDTQQGKNR